VLCGRDLWESSHVVSAGEVSVCQVCVEDASELIRGASVGMHQLVLPPRVFGTVPDPEAPELVARAVAAAIGPEPEEGWGASIEDATELRSYIHLARQRFSLDGASGEVRRIRFDAADAAWVLMVVKIGEGAGGIPFEGPVRRIDGRWKVSRQLSATMLARAGIQIPPAA